MPEAPYLFVSYASADRERVLPLVDRLEAAGVKTWVDRVGIHGGANYAQVINDAIQGSAALLLFASPASLASRNVKQELALGWRYERPYLPLLLDPVTIPGELAYWLEGSQWIELLDRADEVWLRELAKALQPYGIAMTPPDNQLPPRARGERPLLVGREREQSTLRTHLDRMLAGQGSVVLVGGEAGIGKTTLVEDLSMQAEDVGALVLWGHAYDLSVTPPYGPWLELFRQYRRLAGALPPVPDFIFDAEALARVGSQDTLFAEVADFFRSVAAQRPLVLVLDDLHWADQASLDLFRFLVRQVADQRLLLIATYRSDELTRRHPLYILLPLLVREAGAVRLEVQPLDAGGHQALIQMHYALTKDDQARLEQYLVERAEGNPLYAGELLRTLEEERVLRPQENGWVLGDLERVQVPGLLMQVIEGRLARLSDGTRSLLQIAAVIGQEVPLELWQQVSGASDEALVTAIEEGQGAQLLLEVAGGQSYRFRHALLREALYQEVVALRRRVWHRQVGEALAATRSPDPDAVARHFQQAGDSRAVDWLLTAGERARAAYSWVTAAERLEAALTLMTAQGAPAAERSTIVFRIALLTRHADPRQALTLIREARSLAEEAGQVGLDALCRFMEGNLQCVLGDIRAGLATMEAGASAVTRLSDAELETLAATTQRPELEVGLVFGPVVGWLANAGYLRRAVTLGEQRITSAPAPARPVGQVGSPYGGSPYADGWFGLARAYALLGQPQQAQQAVTQARAAYQTIEHHVMVAQTYAWELKFLQLPYFADQPAEQFRQLVAAGMAAAQKASATSRLVLRGLFTLPLLWLQGDWDQAQAAATSVAEDDVGGIPRLLTDELLAQLAWARGDTTPGMRVIGESFPEGPSTAPGNTNLVVALSLQRLAARLALDSHDLPTARAWLGAHDRWLDWSEAVQGRAEDALLWAAYHHANGDMASAHQQAALALTRATDPRQPLALIAAHRVLGTLDTEAEQFDAAEEHLKQSLALAEACQAPFERALTLLELVQLRAAQGKPDEARALLTEVRTICAPLGAKPTLEKIAALEQQLGTGAEAV